MQLEKGLVILEATAPMESFRESSATVTSHACVCTYFHVRSYVCICLEGVCLQRYNRCDCPPQSYVCVRQHVCARAGMRLLLRACATLTGASCPCFSSWWRQTYAVLRLCFVLVWFAARVAAGGFVRSPMWIPGGSWLLGTRLVDIMPCVWRPVCVCLYISIFISIHT